MPATPRIIVALIVLIALIVVALVIVTLTISHLDERAEQAMAFVLGTCRKEQRVGVASSSPISEREIPETIDPDRQAELILEEAMESARSVKGHNRAASEIADQKLIGMIAECRRRKRYAPRRIDLR